MAKIFYGMEVDMKERRTFFDCCTILEDIISTMDSYNTDSIMNMETGELIFRNEHLKATQELLKMLAEDSFALN